MSIFNEPLVEQCKEVTTGENASTNTIITVSSPIVLSTTSLTNLF